MVGTAHFSYFQTGKETTHGTPVAATRRWYPENTGLWNLDRHRSFHSPTGRGTATGRTYATQKGVTLDIPYQSSSEDGCSFNEILIPLSQLDAAQTGTGPTAFVWAFAVNQTSQEDYETFTVEYGDNTQEYEAEACSLRGFSLSADASSPDNMTQLSMDIFGRQSTKSTKTASLSNTDVRIPAYLWNVRFATAFSGLAGASDQANFLRSFQLDVDTGIRPHWYADGNTYFGQKARSAPVDATLTMVVDSGTTAVSEFYDKAAADTMDWVQLQALGPTLGATTYIVQAQMAVLYEDPTILSSSIDGVLTYQVVAHLALDTAWTGGSQAMAWAVTTNQGTYA